MKSPGAAIRATLESIFAQEVALDFEVAIVDSGSSQAELDVMRGFPLQLSQIPPSEFGHGRTRNLLARQAKGQVLVFLTQDAEPADRRWLTKLLAPLEDERVAGVYSRQLPRPDANPMMRFFLQETYPATPSRRRIPNSKFQIPNPDAPEPEARNSKLETPIPNSQLPTPDSHSALPLSNIFFSNVGSAIRRELWQRIPFREDVVMSEDQYWAAAALQAGYELAYEPAACLLHSHNYSLAAAFRRNVESGTSLRGLIADTHSNITGGGLRYLARELAYLARRGQLGWLPYMLAYELMRGAGFAWGFNFGHV